MNLYTNVVKAVCVLNSQKVNGVVYLDQVNDYTIIRGTIKGLNPNQLHAIHIHEFGDLTEGCTSCCSHYNPHKMNHGGPNSADRHVGDLGNIQANSEGVAEFEIIDGLVRLSGNFSVIGRSIVIHQDPDDLGLGGHSDSLTTGHAGKRIVCGVIGLRANSCK
jgi:Cu-Zn family superoxide dismutase